MTLCVSGADDGNRTRVFSLGSRFDPSAGLRSASVGVRRSTLELGVELRQYSHGGPCESTAVQERLACELPTSCVTLVSLTLGRGLGTVRNGGPQRRLLLRRQPGASLARSGEAGFVSQV